MSGEQVFALFAFALVLFIFFIAVYAVTSAMIYDKKFYASKWDNIRIIHDRLENTYEIRYDLIFNGEVFRENLYDKQFKKWEDAVEYKKQKENEVLGLRFVPADLEHKESTL